MANEPAVKVASAIGVSAGAALTSEPTISSAVGVSANSSLGGPAGKERAKRIEKAMQDAVLDASAEGLRVNEDAAEIKARMMAARQRVLDEEAVVVPAATVATTNVPPTA